MSLPATNSSESVGLGQAFVDPVLDSQAVFRAVMSALAEPGTVHQLDQELQAPGNLHPTAARLLLALADFETPIWLSPALSETCTRWISFHTGAPIVCPPADAKFAVLDGQDAAHALAAFDPGEERYPDKSATLIVQVASFVGGDAVTLSGPGIATTRSIAPAGLHAGFWSQAVTNHGRYPLGIDMLFVAGDALMGLPRSTAITRAGGDN
ncbi:MAG: phosphonate C-P lyase system protein PhnH [Hyphomicrobiaceae bacterium]